MGAPLAVWQRELGDSYPAVEPLLMATDRIAGRYPGARSDLPMMRVVDYRDGRFAAVCDEEMSPRLELTREQVVMRRVDETLLRSTLCRSLSLMLTRDPVSPLPGLLRIGTWQSTPSDQRPAFVAVASDAVHLVELILLAMTSTRGPLVLLTPTRVRWSSQSESVADPDRVSLIALDEVLEWCDGQWFLSTAGRSHFSASATLVESVREDATPAGDPIATGTGRRRDGVYRPRTIIFQGAEHDCDALTAKELAFLDVALLSSETDIGTLMHGGHGAVWREPYVATTEKRNKVSGLITRLNAKLMEASPPLRVSFGLRRGQAFVYRQAFSDGDAADAPQ